MAIGWNDEEYPGKKPEGWAELWDVKNFPGGRTIRPQAPVYDLEDGLDRRWRADGQALSARRRPRASRSSRSSEADVLVWWSSGAQSAQVLKDGEVDMVPAWNGRIQALESKPEGKAARSGITLQPADPRLRQLDDPERRAEQGTCHEGDRDHVAAGGERAHRELTSTTGPSNTKAFDTGVIRREVAKGLPNSPENVRKGFVLDANYVGR